jgi:hypothetical protein
MGKDLAARLAMTALAFIPGVFRIKAIRVRRPEALIQRSLNLSLFLAISMGAPLPVATK